MYPESPEPVIKPQYALCHEERIKKKKKVAISKGWHERVPQNKDKETYMEGLKKKEKQEKEKKNPEVL